MISSTVADHLWDTIETAGVRTIYGLPGTTNLDALEALRTRASLRFVVTRHEQCAGHMADASARMFAPFGVCLVDLGPGLANTTTAMLAAGRDSSPLVVIAGNEARWLIGREVWHEMPEIETFQALTKFAARVERAEDFPRLLERALRTATSGRPGPVLLSVPKDVWNEEIQVDGPLRVASTLAPPSEGALEQAADALRQAKHPVIVAGGGARKSVDPRFLARLCERHGLFVVTSPNGRGVLPEDHPHCLGHAGRFGQRQASKALREADLLLTIGCRLSDLTTNNWSLLSRDQNVIQVDSEAAMIGRNWPAKLAIVADAGRFVESLGYALPEDFFCGWDLSSLFEERKAEREQFYAISDAEKVKPQAVMGALERQVEPEHTLIMGGGRFQQFVGEWLTRGPKGFFYAANSGTVGFALSAAIGTAIEHSDRQVICGLGDGDFMMHMQELETAVREGANLKCVVLNDFAYGAMKARQSEVFGTTYNNPDFAELARTLGAQGRRVDRGGEIPEAVEWLLTSDGVCVLDVQMDLDENRSLMYGHDIGSKVDSG